MPKNHRIQSLRRQAFECQGGRCYYCGVRMWLATPAELPGGPPKLAASSWPKLRCTAEHLLAQSEGGGDTRENIAAACAHCNHSRHKRRSPPEPLAYRDEIRRRVEQGRWHGQGVYELGLLPLPGPAACTPAST